MMDFNSDSPVYMQIVESIKRQIFGGFLDPGQRIPPVREMAAEFGVNPNTMQKALAELERLGLLYARRTSGRFITSDEYLIIRQRREMLDSVIGRFLTEMHQLGCTYDEVLSFISQNMQYPEARTIVNADLDDGEVYTGALPYGATLSRGAYPSHPAFDSDDEDERIGFQA